MTTFVDWIARILAWTAITIFGSVVVVGLGYKLWLIMSDDWNKTLGIAAVVTGWGIIVGAIQRTWQIW